MLRFKTDILALLKEKGFSTYKLRKEKILGEATIQKLRERKIPGIENLNWLCAILNVQPGDIIEYIPDQKADKE